MQFDPNLNNPSNSWAVIYCPKEGSPRTHHRWGKIRSYLQQQGIQFDYVQSEGAGSVERLASMMTRAGYHTIIVVGGDAALNHALCGVMQSTFPGGGHPALGVIPNGFGNDFAKYWGFASDDYKTTIDALLHRRTRKVDVGRVAVTHEGKADNYFFFNCVTMGVAANITDLRRRTRSILGSNTLSFFSSALLLLFQRTNFKVNFSMHGEHFERRAMTLCVGSAHGYGMTPSAVPYNGLLDMTLVTKPLFTQMAHGLYLLLTGRFLSHKGVEVWRTNYLDICNEGRSKVAIDGRVLHVPVESLAVSVMPEEIDFLIP